MKIIAFSGVDGSGKSTQTSMLEEFFEGQGYKVSYFHATEFSLANRLQRKAHAAPFVPGKDPGVTEANFLQVLARLLFLFIDGLRFHSYQQCLERSGVNVLLSDRFFQDSLINICYLSKNPLLRIFVRILANVLPVPEHTFYLQLSAEDVLKRERVPEQGMPYLEEKIALFNRHPFPWVHHIIDATQSPGSTHQDILTKLANV